MKTFAEIEFGGYFGFYEQDAFCLFRKLDENSAEFIERDGSMAGGIITDFDPDYMVFPVIGVYV